MCGAPSPHSGNSSAKLERYTDPQRVGVAADFNGDKVPDVVSANGGGDLSLFIGMGKGLFQPAVAIPQGVNPHWVTATDFDRDGALDLAASDPGSNVVRILGGDGKGRFTKQLELPLAVGVRVHVVADFNGDGRPDIAAAGYEGKAISVLLNTSQ